MAEHIIEKKEFRETIKINECIVTIRWNDTEERQTPRIRKESFDIVYKKIRETISELESWGIYPDEFSFNVNIKI